MKFKSWCKNIEQSAIKQIENICNLPFLFCHLAIMPDCHCGYGVPIGSVLCTKNVVIPNAVGVDIGCGMCFVKTNIQHEDINDKLLKIIEEIKNTIPVGFKVHDEWQKDEIETEIENTPKICMENYDRAMKSLGTLGGGNHFIEIQKDENDFVCFMIHTGSRNLGKQVADYYNKRAVELNERYFSEVKKSWELAFFPKDDELFEDYINEMEYCLDFAFENRMLIIERIKNIILENIGSVVFDETINIHHNYASIENHFESNVVVHRKGATSAKLGEIGIIPGSQGTKSYIVKGLGNIDSYNSCSHGAGRLMGRKEAIRTLSLEKERERMKEIIHSLNVESDLDEAPGCYKDIDDVMSSQSDLVEIVLKLTPLAVIKG